MTCLQRCPIACEMKPILFSGTVKSCSPSLPFSSIVSSLTYAPHTLLPTETQANHPPSFHLSKNGAFPFLTFLTCYCSIFLQPKPTAASHNLYICLRPNSRVILLLITRRLFLNNNPSLTSRKPQVYSSESHGSLYFL